MRRGFQSAQFGSQPESQFNTYNKLHLDNRTGASPVMSQTFSQRSVGNAVGLQRGINPGTLPTQLSLPSMSQLGGTSQLGGMSQTQQQAYSNRPLSSGFIPTSQPALSGVFRPGSAPQHPTPSQLDMPLASQWTQPAVTSSLGGQGHKSGHQGGLLQQQQLPASNQSMLRPKKVSLLRTTGAAPHLQARPGSAPGLLSGAPPSSSPAQAPHQFYNHPPSHLQPHQQQQQHFHGTHNQQPQRYQNQQGSQGGLGATFNLLGSQQQLQDSPIVAPSQQQGNFGGVMTVDDGSAGTGVALGSDPAAAMPTGPTQQQQRQAQPAAGTSAAAANRLGPRLRALLQELPPASQKPQQFDIPPEDAFVAPAGSTAIAPAVPGEGNDKSTAPAAASNAVTGRLEAPITAAAALTAVQPPPQPALDPELVMQRISSLEDHCSSMSAVIQRDIPLLLKQQDSTSLQLQSMKNDNAKDNAALEARLQKLTSSVASFMDGLRGWQLQQQQLMQQLQEQAAKQQPQLVLSHAECQTSPGLLPSKVQQTDATATAKPADAADYPAAAGCAEVKPATQPVFSPSGKRYIRESDVTKPAEHKHGSLYKQGMHNSRQGLYGGPALQSNAAAAQYQQQVQQQSMLALSSPSPSATAAAAGAGHIGAASIPAAHAVAMTAAAAPPEAAAAAETRQDVDNTNDQDGQGTADAPSPQHQKPSRTRKKPASRARKPAAKPRGKAAAAAAKAAEAQEQAEAAAAPAVPAAVHGSGKQPTSSLVQTKLNFGKRTTRSAAAKDAAAVEAAVTASLGPEVTTAATAATAVAADIHPHFSPAVGTSTDVYMWKDGGAAAPAVDADSDAPPAWLIGNDDALPGVNGQQRQQRSCGRPIRYAGGSGVAAASGMRQQGSQSRNKVQQQQVLTFTHSTAAASGTAAAASGAGRQFHRRMTPPPAACMTAANGSGMMQKTAVAGPAAQHDIYSDVPGSPAGFTAAASSRQPVTTQLPPTQYRRGPTAAPIPTAVNRGQQRPLGAVGVAAAAGSGYGRQAPAKLPPAARSGASTAAAAAAAARAPARPTHSGAGGFTRPTYSIQQHQCTQPLASGGTSRLLGMKRDQPEPAAPARSSVQMLFGDMDSDSMDCVVETETQQQKTGPMHQVADAHDVVGACAAVSSRRRNAVATADMVIDRDDLAQQVAARMAQHRDKQRRIAQGSGFAR